MRQVGKKKTLPTLHKSFSCARVQYTLMRIIMNEYPFRLICDEQQDSVNPDILEKRPFLEVDTSFAAEAKRFIPGTRLETAINTAIAVGTPLLITGEPGTGKTQTAYYAAYKLGIEPVIHFQVKSDSTAKDLLYHFDTVRYFHDAHLPKPDAVINKKYYVEKRALWEAMESKKSRVVLIDEIDKAPRDFPNDLLLELDKMEFTITETGETITICDKKQYPLIFITSNSEHRLPEPFLRRCVYHHIHHFDEKRLKKVLEKRKDEFAKLSDGFIELAVQRFLDLRSQEFRKKPATGEFLLWLRVLILAMGTNSEQMLEKKLQGNLVDLPYLGTLLKDRQDLEDLEKIRNKR
jgi:MoxR-like ATPase